VKSVAEVLGFPVKNGRTIKVEWLEVHEQELNGLSLNDLLHILENRPVTP
jgi:hypothetical protein